MKETVFADGPSPDDMIRCVHCGYCITTCPTYRTLSLEMDSPRGRIHLIQALTEGRAEPTSRLLGHLDLCIQCRACETACPAGVSFARIMEHGRALVLSRPKAAPRSWRLRASLARSLLPHPGRLRILATFLRLYQRLGLQWLVRSTRLLKLLPGHLYDVEQFLPPLPSKAFKPVPVVEPRAGVEPVRRVALLTGCVTPVLYPHLHESTIRVLTRHGCQVLMPPEQTCCGALHLHAGDLEATRELARRNIDVFLALDVEAVVVNAAGCTSTLKEYAELLKGDPEYAEKAARFAALVKDITEFLAALPLQPVMGFIQARVTYQDSCHLAHAQGITAQPRAILQAIPGLDFVEMERSTDCCGSGGVYNVTQPELSLSLLRQKMKNVEETKAEIVATANTGCMMQLQAGVRRFGPKGTQVAHVVELLDEAYLIGDKAR